jgi:hypothetical protein
MIIDTAKLRELLKLPNESEGSKFYLKDAIEKVECWAKEYLNRKPIKVLGVYDNGGKTLDRYTVVYDIVEGTELGRKLYSCLGMNAAPFHPQGIGMHGTAIRGRHLGKKIKLTDLPEDCQKAVALDLA